MSETNFTLEYVKELYDNQSYHDAAKAALELIKNGENIKDAYMFFAKSYLFMLQTPSNEQHLKTFYDAINNIAKHIASPDELLNCEYDLRCAYREWVSRTFENAVYELENAPSFDNWKAFLRYKVQYLEIDLLISMNLRKTAESVVTNAGLELKDLKGKTVPPCFDEETIDTLLFGVACKTFQSTQAIVSQNRNASGEYWSQASRNVVEKLLLSKLMISSILPKQGADLNAVQLEYFKTYATILRYIVETTVCPNGQLMSLYMADDRYQLVQDIDNTYKRIKEFEPEFEAPELPSSETIKSQPASGGCYIATSVYGSYNCPEVWTLRRYRDSILAKTFLGRTFIKLYYATSPTAVKLFGKKDWFNSFWKSVLDKKIIVLQEKGIENTPYSDK